MKILVCGGRDFANKALIFDVLEQIHTQMPITVLVHGAAKGADTLAGDWAATHPEIEIKPYPAQWEKYGKKAGILRNMQMLIDEVPEMVIAFSGGRGTNHMVLISKEADIPVLVC